MGRALGLHNPRARESRFIITHANARRHERPNDRGDPKGPCPFAGSAGELVERRMASLPEGDHARTADWGTGRRDRPPLRLAEGSPDADDQTLR